MNQVVAIERENGFKEMHGDLIVISKKCDEFYIENKEFKKHFSYYTLCLSPPPHMSQIKDKALASLATKGVIMCQDTFDKLDDYVGRIEELEEDLLKKSVNTLM